jgi:hypothetical protein
LADGLPFAVKTLLKHHAGDEESLRRFRREVEIQKRQAAGSEAASRDALILDLVDVLVAVVPPLQQPADTTGRIGPPRPPRVPLGRALFGGNADLCGF